jgi:hypothetical protein
LARHIPSIAAVCWSSRFSVSAAPKLKLELQLFDDVAPTALKIYDGAQPISRKNLSRSLAPRFRLPPIDFLLGFASSAKFRDIVRRFSRAIYETPGRNL